MHHKCFGQVIASTTISLAFFSATFADSPPKLNLKAILPTGDVTIEFLDFSMGKRGNELAAKFQRDTDSEWLQKYVARVSKPGQPLPYHQNFGLTKAEYKEFLQASNQIKIVSTGIEWKCNFQLKNGVFTMVPLDQRSATLHSIRIDLDSTRAMASGVELGVAKYSDDGPSRGYRWKLEPEISVSELASGADFLMARLDFLLMNDSDYVRVNYSIQQRVGGTVRVSKEFAFRYRVPEIHEERAR